jgi:O-antigen ligase
VAGTLLHRFGTEGMAWIIRREPALCALLALSVVSCVWSLAPTVTLRRAVSVLATTLLGVFIGFVCPPRRFVRVLYWSFAILITSSVASALWFPAHMRAGDPVGWRGVMDHKNYLGEAALFATIFFLIVTLKRRVHPVPGGILCALSLVAALGSRSRTSIAAMVLAAALLAYLVLRRPAAATARRAFLGLVVAVSVVPFLVGPIATRLGHNDPLNGRTSIWAGSLTIIKERPMTGYGFGAVWGRRRATLLPSVPATAHRSAVHAHNSVINIATETGIPAAILAWVFLFGAFSNALRHFERDPTAFSVFVLALVLSVTMFGFAEAVLVQSHSLVWILLVALAVTVHRSLENQTVSIEAQQ